MGHSLYLVKMKINLGSDFHINFFIAWQHNKSIIIPLTYLKGEIELKEKYFQE